jgi:hypothetical protein
MGYYTRVLTTTDDSVTVSVLSNALKKAGSSAVIQFDGGADAADWEQLTLTQKGGPEIAMIERSGVEEGSLGEAEIQEFEDELDETLPKSSAAWLRTFFPRVRCVYSFQHLSGSHTDEGFAALRAVRDAVWQLAPAIIQADGEGFTDEDGYQITWDFSDKVKGDWWMGLFKGGQPVHFQMDLGNSAHREAFRSGLVPEGVKLA